MSPFAPYIAKDPDPAIKDPAVDYAMLIMRSLLELILSHLQYYHYFSDNFFKLNIYKHK